MRESHQPAGSPAPSYKQLFLTLANGDEIRLDAVDRSTGGAEVTLTMTNGQTVSDCFWLDEMSRQVQTNEPKVRKLLRFVHDRNRPAYHRALDAVRPYLPSFIVNMNGYTLLAFYVALVAVAGWLYYSFGREALPFLFPLTFFVVAITLGFDQPEMAVDLDFNTVEDVAHTMLGRPPSGAVRIPKPE